MNNKKTNPRKKKPILLGLSIIIMIFINLISTSISVDYTYSVVLNKETVTYIVSEYDKDEWEENVNKDMEPDDWFGGDSDKIGAKSKMTIRSINDYKWNALDVLTLIFGVLNSIPPNKLLYFLLNFTKKIVTTHYPDKYEAWESLCVKWDFEEDEFEEEPNDSEILVPVFQDPKDFKEILKLYNTWAAHTNLMMMMLELDPFPTISGDEFLWNLVLDGKLFIAQPFDKYLDAIVDALDCKDVYVKGKKLYFVEEDYSVIITFSDQGTQANLVIMNSRGKVVYEIIQDNTTLVALISIGVIISAIVGVLVVFVKKRIKTRKNRELKRRKKMDNE